MRHLNILARLALGLAVALAPIGADFALAAPRRPLVIVTGQPQTLPTTDALQTSAPTTATASINLPHGSAPTSPVNGDCWTTTGGLYCRIAGVTVGPMGAGGGVPGGSSGQIQYNNSGAFDGFTLAGDCTIAVPNVTCAKTGGVAFGSFATGTSAANLTGTVSVNRFNSGTGASSSTYLRGDGTWVTPTAGAPGGSAGQIQYNNSGVFDGFTLAGDCTIVVPNVTCAKTGGVSFGAFATGTDAANLTGTVSVNRFNSGTGASGSTVLYGDGTWRAIGAGSAGGNSMAWPIQGTPSASGASLAAHGTYFTVLSDFAVSGLWALMNTVSGATYRVSIYQVNTSGVISAVIADSANITSPGTVTGATVGAKFSSPVTLTAGNNYIVSHRRTDGGDTVIVGVYGLSTSAFPTYTGLPISYVAALQTKFATLAKATPAVGDTYTLAGAGYYAIAVLYTAF